MPAQHSTRSWPRSRGKEFRGCRRTPVQQRKINGLFHLETPMNDLHNLSYLGNSVLHDLLVFHIALVANKQLVDTLGGVSVNLLEPLLHIVEGVHVGDIVNHANSVSTTVVRRGDGTETFLASGVPLYELLALPRIFRVPRNRTI